MGNKQAKHKGDKLEENLGLFNQLPTELLWMILGYLCDDPSFQGPPLLQTLTNFSLASKSCHELCHFQMFKYIYEKNPFFDPTLYNELIQSQEPVDWFLIQKQTHNKKFTWNAEMSSPFIRLKNHRKVATGKKSEILMHACYAEPPFSKGVLTIHYLLECPTWGLSVGIGLAAIGPFPDTNFIQMFSDTTMGLFGDRLEFMPGEEPPPLKLGNYGETLTIEHVQKMNWREGDIVSVRVNMFARTAEFFINQIPCVIVRGLELYRENGIPVPFYFMVKLNLSTNAKIARSVIRIVDDNIPLPE